jgi:hypothetical protein
MRKVKKFADSPFVRAMLETEDVLKAKKNPESKPANMADIWRRTGFPMPTLTHWNNGKQPSLKAFALAASIYNWSASRIAQVLSDEAARHFDE